MLPPAASWRWKSRLGRAMNAGNSPRSEHDRGVLPADTGIAGLSVEDSSGDEGHPLFGLDLAIHRVSAARGAIDRSGTASTLLAWTRLEDVSAIVSAVTPRPVNL